MKESCHTDERVLSHLCNWGIHFFVDKELSFLFFLFCTITCISIPITFAIGASKFLLGRFESERLITLRARVRLRATRLLHVAACFLNGCKDEQACVCVGEFVSTYVRFVWLFVYVTSACSHLRVAIYRSMSSCPICILMHA